MFDLPAFDRAYPAVMRRMDGAYFESGALARQAARANAETRRLCVTSDSGLFWSNELRHLRGAEEFLYRGRHRLRVIISCGMIGSLSAIVRRSFTARSTRTKPMRKGVLRHFADAAHPAIAKWSMSSTWPLPLRNVDHRSS